MHPTNDVYLQLHFSPMIHNQRNFRRKELDFPESSQFYESYYVIASDEPRLRKVLNMELVDHLGSKSDLFIEVHETATAVF